MAKNSRKNKILGITCRWANNVRNSFKGVTYYG